MKRRAARLAWFLWALSFALTALYVALLALSWGGPGPLTVEEDIAIVPVYLLMFIIFSTVGAVIASRRPENSIGWLFCGASIAMAGGFSAQLYAQYALFGRSDALLEARLHSGCRRGLASWVCSSFPPSCCSCSQTGERPRVAGASLFGSRSPLWCSGS